MSQSPLTLATNLQASQTTIALDFLFSLLYAGQGCPVNIRDGRGNTAAHIATQHGNVVTQHTDAPAESPPHRLTHRGTLGSQGALQALVFNGVDIEAENANGATVLQLARAFGREACEEFLMERVR